MAQATAAQTMSSDDPSGAGAGAASGTGAGTGAGGAADAGAGDDTGDQQPTKIASILCYPDGSFGLEQGDGDDDDEGEGAAEPQKFAGIGELLKGVMEAVKDYESQKSGEGDDQSNFDAGFQGEAGQKY